MSCALAAGVLLLLLLVSLTSIQKRPPSGTSSLDMFSSSALRYNKNVGIAAKVFASDLLDQLDATLCLQCL